MAVSARVATLHTLLALGTLGVRHLQGVQKKILAFVVRVVLRWLQCGCWPVRQHRYHNCEELEGHEAVASKVAHERVREARETGLRGRLVEPIL